VRDAVAKGDVKAAREAAQKAVRKRREARAERGKKDRPGAKKRMRERRRAGDRAGGADRARRARWAALQARYGRSEANPQSVSPRLKAELRRHARRLAQIERIRELAEDKDNESLDERAEVLLEMELARHESRLERFGADALAADEGPEEVQ
ncbi:MAG: hypothetical protein ACODAG_06280, partial [Myxococcota bacterium]